MVIGATGTATYEIITFRCLEITFCNVFTTHLVILGSMSGIAQKSSITSQKNLPAA
jgi:hypothetical protein